jgi:hypothetical protein
MRGFEILLIKQILSNKLCIRVKFTFINVGLWTLTFDGLYINNQINRWINNDNFRSFNIQIMVIIWWRKCIWIYIIHIQNIWIWKCSKRLLKKHVASNTTYISHFTFIIYVVAMFSQHQIAFIIFIFS